MPWGAAIGAIGAVAAADKSSKASQSTKNEIDPRLASYLFGEDDKSGLLGDMNQWYQANRSGMNDQMAQGLNTQWGVYNDPNTMAGYQQMANLGSGLMSAPMLGNPFSDGRVSLRSGANLGAAPAASGSANLGIGAAQPQQAQQYPSFTRPTAGAPAAGAPASSAGPFSSALPTSLVKPTPVVEPEAPTPNGDWFNQNLYPGNTKLADTHGGVNGWVWDNATGIWKSPLSQAQGG